MESEFYPAIEKVSSQHKVRNYHKSPAVIAYEECYKQFVVRV
jgi:hypothetical protein